MTTSDIRPGERVKDVRFTEESLSVDLLDGRTITVPLAWYPRLLHATPEQRVDWQICGGGYGIHWTQVDEDLSTEGMLRGAPASRRSLPVQASQGQESPLATGVHRNDPSLHHGEAGGPGRRCGRSDW